MKQIRIFVGEEEKTEMGIAYIEPLPSGDSMVRIEITNNKVAMLLGGKEIKGVLTRQISEQPSMEQETEDNNE